MVEKQINLTWTKTLSEQDAKKFQEQFNANYRLFERLQEIIDEKILAVTTERISKSSFEVAAWAEYQAYLNGREAALTDLKTLLKLRD